MQPLRAFLLLLSLILVLTSVVVFFLKEDPEPPVDGPRSTNFALTDTEALQRFKELRELARRAVQKRDASLVSIAFTSNSPTGNLARDEISSLLRREIVDRSRFQIVSASILSNRPDEIEIAERVRLRPCFETESGKDVTDSVSLIEQEGRWILRLEDTQWKIHQILLDADRVIDRQPARCHD